MLFSLPKKKKNKIKIKIVSTTSSVKFPIKYVVGT